MMRVALYARVSTDEQAEKYGLDSQLRALRDLAAARGWEVVAEFKDDGYSGATLDRPDLTRLRDAIRTHTFDVVLIHDPDRLARDLVYALLLEREFQQAGVPVEYVTVATDDSPAGQLQRQILGAIAEFERKKIRERTVRGKLEKARRGLLPGGFAPFGYRLDANGQGGLAVVPDQAEIVRLMFCWLLDGTSLRQIVDRLNARGVRAARAARWGKTSVRRTLTNEVYAGRAHFGEVTIPAPTIISRATFERARDQLERNKLVLSGCRGRRLYLLKGLLVCGGCGQRFASDARSPDRPCYKCRGRDRLAAGEGDRCRARTWSAEALERAVWDAVAGVLRDPEVLLTKVREQRGALDARRVEASTAADDLRRQLQRIRRQRERLLALYLDDQLPKDALYADRDRDLQREEATTADRLARAEAATLAADAQAQHQDAVLRYCRLIRRGIDRLDDSGRQRLLRLLVDRIVVQSRRLEIHGILPAAAREPKPPSGPGGGNCSDSPRCRPAPVIRPHAAAQLPRPFGVAAGSTLIWSFSRS